MLRRIISVILCVCLLTIPTVRAGEEKYVALTLDDGPSGRFTRRLLEGLEQRQVHATFLLCGYRMAAYPGLTKQIYEAGHEIGLHGYSHQDFTTLSQWQLQKELEDTRALLPSGCNAVFLRPPGGSGSPTVERVARKMGLSLLLWSVDPRDWAIHDATAVETAVISQVQDGDVILLHDLSDSSVDAALAIVDKLQKEGFRFVTVSQMAKIRGIAPEPGKTYKSIPAGDG